MTTDNVEGDLPGLGHNQPPEPTGIDIARDLVTTANRWIVERPRIDSAEIATRAADFIAQLVAVGKKLGEERAAALKPHEDQVAAIKATYLDPVELVKAALAVLRAKSKDWLDREDARLLAERRAQEEAAKKLRDEALKKTQEAADAQMTGNAPYLETQREADLLADQARRAEKAVAKPVPVAATRGDYAPKALTRRTTWRARIVDPKLCLRHYAKHPSVARVALEEATRCANADARQFKDPALAPPGVEFWADTSVI